MLPGRIIRVAARHSSMCIAQRYTKREAPKSQVSGRVQVSIPLVPPYFLYFFTMSRTASATYSAFFTPSVEYIGRLISLSENA